MSWIALLLWTLNNNIPYTFEWFSSLVRPLLVQKLSRNYQTGKAQNDFYSFLFLQTGYLNTGWTSHNGIHNLTVSSAWPMHPANLVWHRTPFSSMCMQLYSMLNKYWPLTTDNLKCNYSRRLNQELWSVGGKNELWTSHRKTDGSRAVKLISSYIHAVFFSGHLGQNSPWIWNFLPKDRYR